MENERETMESERERKNMESEEEREAATNGSADDCQKSSTEETASETQEKPVMLVAIDDSETSLYGLEWALEHFFTPFVPNYPFKLILIHATPSPTTAIGLSGPGAAVLSYVDVDHVKATTGRVVEKAKEVCISKGIDDVAMAIVEGDPRNVICDAVDQYSASMLVVSSHGYGAIKRAVLGSVSDYCAHHAHCSVMIVKKPKSKT